MNKYRRGAVIRQPVPHPEHPSGARRWRVLGVEGDDYYVMALFSDGTPLFSHWNTRWCDAVTELEHQDDVTGRITAGKEKDEGEVELVEEGRE